MVRPFATETGGTRERLVTVETESGPASCLTRIRPIPPWRDSTAALVLDLVETHTRCGDRVVLDLTDCESTSTAQLAVIIIGLRQARARRAPLEVEGPPALRSLAQICGVDGFVEWRISSAAG